MWVCLLAFVACSDDATEVPTPPEEPQLPEVTVTAGQVSETSIEVTLSAKNANWMTCMHLSAAEDEAAPGALEVFRRNEFVVEASEQAVSYVIEDLKPGTTYIIYAAARMDEEYSDVQSLQIATPPVQTALSFVEAGKSMFAYRVDVPEGTIYQHCYIEGWYFDYMLASQQLSDGPDFDMNVFLWNMLVDFGYQAEGPQTFYWSAGDDNEKHGSMAMIVGGKKYYALFSLFEPDNFWFGTPEFVSFETQPAGESNSTMNIIGEEVSPTKIRIRMEADPAQVHFFFYDLYNKASFDEVKAAKGQAGIMDYLYEYGHAVGNTYTDVWITDPGQSYMLAIMGVDPNGDIFYLEKQFDTEQLQPELSVDMRAFERELQGYHAYDTFEVVVTASSFGEIDTDRVLWFMQPKAQIDSMLEMLGGLTFDMLADALETSPEALQYLMMFNPMPLPTEWADQLAANGYFTAYLTDNYDETAYYFVCAVPHNDSYKLAYATAATEAMPQAGETDEQYKAFLGEWTLEGQSSEDYYTRKSYTLRFEELTPNRSYKVYGWSESDISQKYPFEARYSPDTKKITIEGHQLLGTETVGDKELQVLFEGFLMMNGDLQLAVGFTGPVFVGALNGNRLSLFPEYVVLDGYYYEFRTLAYAGYEESSDIFYLFPGDTYPLVNFIVNRAASQSAAKRPSAKGSSSALRAMQSLVWRPETNRPVAAAPAVRDAGARQPAVFVR